jgi:cytoskeletal protein CcmA (bactofilin family)
MGFFTELKSDLSQAVNSLLPGEEEERANDPLLAAAMAAEPVTDELPADGIDPMITDELGEVPNPDANVGVVIDETTGDRTVEDVFREAQALEEETGSDTAADSLDGLDLDSMLSRIDQLDGDFMSAVDEPAAEEPVMAEMPAEPVTELPEMPAEPAMDLPEMPAEEPAAKIGILPEELPADLPEPAADEPQQEFNTENFVQTELPLNELETSVFAEPAAVPEENDVFSEAIAAAISPLQETIEAPPEPEPDPVADGADAAFVESALSAAVPPAEEPHKESKSSKGFDRKHDKKEYKQEEEKMEQQAQQLAAPTDENAVITAGMIIDGDVTTSGSLDVIGKINGNVTAYGKLNVTGALEGNLTAAEIYAENARITGEVRSQGAAKIGQSSVILGNIYATSAVIAGAVKGDIDVHGPVVLDTTAIVMGNIKSQSVQINNGAVIEGMCSQTYAEVNPQAFFDGLSN